MLRLALTSSIAASLLQIVLAHPLDHVSGLPYRQNDPRSITEPSSLFSSRDLSGSLKECLEQTHATLTYPSSSKYAGLAKAENSNYHPKPEVIVQPTSTDQVAAIVKCVEADHGSTKFSPRGGGHGYSAYSLSGQVVMDSSKLNKISIDSDAKTVTVGAGQTLGPLASEMADKGFALPHGTCPTVGVAGHGLGGGWGYGSRKWGWLMDHIVSMEFVDVKGNIKTLSPSSQDGDADLWWALRGAGSNNFGVATEFTYKMEQAPSAAVNYNHLYSTNEDCAQVLVSLQNIGLKKPDEKDSFPLELGGELLLFGENSGQDGACTFSGQFLGPKSDYKKAMKILNDDLKNVGVTAAKANAEEFGSWSEALTNLMGDLHQPKVYEPYYAQSIMDDGTPEYTLEKAKGIVDAVQAAVGVEGTGNSISFDLNGPGSLTNAASTTGDMAFNHRNSLFFSQIYSYGFPDFEHAQAQDSALSKISGITESVRNAKPEGNWQAVSIPVVFENFSGLTLNLTVPKLH